MTTKCENSKTTNKRSKTPNTIEDVFPCLSEFNKIICSLTGNRNYQHLEDSLLLYTKHIYSSILSRVKFGNGKFSESNLKNHINNMLIFFHLYWSDIKQDITDHTSYLNKMSTLLNIYVDMELKTSFMETNRDPSEIAARIFAALYIYLNNSEEHIFKVLLRIKDMEKYTKICNHIFMKSFTNLKTKITSINDVAYVRYLLAFKMWKKIEENFDKKKKINELAVMILGSRMPELRHELKFMPKPPRNKKNETSWLLHTDLKDTLHHFLLFEDKMDNFKDLQRTKMKHQINSLHPWSNSSKLKQEISKDHINDSKSHNISSIDRNKPLKKSKKKAKQMKHKQNKIIYIDITGDAPIRVKRYLKIMEENVEKNKKHINYLKFSNELIATNKTNSNKSSKKSVKNEHLNVTNQVNNTSDVINRNVGIYPETLDKVHMGIKSTIDGDNREHDTNNSIPHIVHSSINYETDTLSNNLSIVENNVQSIKENANVILNGETVVLLQKSPNSNLYIINKAVENARDHISDDESCPIKEKNRMISSEDCASFEVNTSEHISFNLNQPQYSKELSCQENKFPVGRNKNIKIEPEEESSLMNITEMKSYGKKGSLSADVLPATSQIYQDTNVANVSISKSIDKRKSKSILTYRQNIKQQFNNHIAPNCGIQGYSGVHSHPHEVIPVTHPATISSIYGNCAAGTDLYMPYHKHCTSVSCRLHSIERSTVDSTTSFHSHKKSANSCGRSHCSGLNGTYNIVTHFRQCIRPATDSHVSCIESNSYFLPNTLDKSNDTCTVSTTCNGDQIVESALYNQPFGTMRMNDYGNVAKYSRTTIKEQERNNCDYKQERSDISMSSDLLHSSELSAFDSFVMDSNEDSEIMKSDSIDDSEKIGFVHNIQETLENVLSNDTIDSLLPLRQSPYELDAVYTDTFSNKKDILCNNQNDTINSNVEPMFCLYRFC